MPRRSKADEMPDLGTCCACGCEPGDVANPVRTIVMLDFKMPPGFGDGWGCFLCGLPAKGASAVVCDRCAELMRLDKAEVRWIMTGVTQKTGRLGVGAFPHVAHDHDMSRHPGFVEPEDYGEEMELCPCDGPHCAICGCCDHRGCVDGDGVDGDGVCIWATPTLCSRCAS